MSRVYTTPAPIMIPTSRTSSDRLTPSDLFNSDSDSLFLLTLARSHFPFPGTPITPTTSSSFGSSLFALPPQHALPQQNLYTLFADDEETPFRGASVWPTGFGYGEDDEDEGRTNTYVATTQSWTSSNSSRGQAVEIHHGTARIKAWAKKAFKKVTPSRWRRAEYESRGRMTLD
ncbi:hypothetical protein FRC01_003292 [Tulasnella sp. 417]|nr:hypothetical protein FRC01_003292 [Tulasnella sp. 417]